MDRLSACLFYLATLALLIEAEINNQGVAAPFI
jgi:hypothetical protein